MWVGGDWTLLGGPLSIITVKKKNLSSTFNHFLHSTLANTYVHTHVQRYVHTHTHTHTHLHTGRSDDHTAQKSEISPHNQHISSHTSGK